MILFLNGLRRLPNACMEGARRTGSACHLGRLTLKCISAASREEVADEGLICKKPLRARHKAPKLKTN